jgi:hypothetical protein
VTTGEPLTSHQFTAPSKESIHVALLAKVLDGDKNAQIFYNVSEALDILTKKIATYEDFNKKYPGFGGFFPWMTVNGSKVDPSPDWVNKVPSLDNGELFWAMYGLLEVLETKYPD